MKKISITLGFFLLTSCTSSDSILLNTEVESGSMSVIDLDTGKRLYQANAKDSIDIVDSLIGIKNVKIEFTSEDNQTLSAIVPKDYSEKSININAFTTIAVCMLEADESSEAVGAKIKTYNALLESLFGIENSLNESPNLVVNSIDTLSNPSRYGLLLKAFEAYAQEFGEDVTQAQLIEALCKDFKKEKRFNGIGPNGFVELGDRNLSDQTLKAKFAGSVYRYAQDKAVLLTQSDAQLLAGEISRNSNNNLFENGTTDFPFETNPPGDIQFYNGLTFSQTLGEGEFEVFDDTNSPTLVTVTASFPPGTDVFDVPNQIQSSSLFVLSYGYSAAEDNIKLIVRAEDIFGNVSFFEYETALP